MNERADYPGNYISIRKIRAIAKPILGEKYWKILYTPRHRFELNLRTGKIYAYSTEYGEDYVWYPKQKKWKKC